MYEHPSDLGFEAEDVTVSLDVGDGLVREQPELLAGPVDDGGRVDLHVGQLRALQVGEHAEHGADEREHDDERDEAPPLPRVPLGLVEVMAIAAILGGLVLVLPLGALRRGP